MHVAALERSLAGKMRRAAINSQMRDIVGELFDLIAATRVVADAMERSAREAPDLGALFYRRVRVRILDQLIEYCRRVDRVGSLPEPLRPELAARFMLETVTWWARHRHRDPDPPAIDDAHARGVAIALVSAALAPGVEQ